MTRALVIAAALLCAPCAAPAEAQDQEIVQLATGSATSQLSSDLSTIVATGADYRGVTRVGRTVVRPRQELGILLESFALRGLNLREPTAPVSAVNELIVSLQTPDTQLTDLPDGATVVDRVTSGSFAVVRAPNGITPELVSALAARPQVTRIEPGYPHFLQGTTQVKPNDPYYPLQRGLESIRVERAWSVTTTTKVMVAVLDTGIDLSHPELARNLWHNPTDRGHDEDKNGCPGDLHGCDFTGPAPKALAGDTHGHGTHVAGIIGAVGDNGDGIAGVAWSVPILGVRVLDDDLRASPQTIVKGLDYAIASGAKVITASFGSYNESSEVREAVARASKAGVLIVAAAGNTEYRVERDNDLLPIYPASFRFRNIISVMAADTADNTAAESRYGLNSIGLAAPGVAVLSTLPGGVTGPRSGTSFAVPFVAGAAALYWGLPSQAAKTAAQIADQLRHSVRPIAGMENVSKGVLDLSFFSPTPVPTTTVAAPKATAQAALDLKPTPIGEPLIWTGRLETIFAAGGESSGFILQMNNRQVELAAPTPLLNQLKDRAGQIVTVRGQLESIRSVERGARQQVRVLEIVK